MPITELQQNLSGLYNGCGCLPTLADEPTDKELDAAIKAMTAELWATKALPEGFIDKEVTAGFARKLWAGVVKGYGKDIFDVDWQTPDWNMLTALQENIWHFSAAKNYTQLRELSNALIGEDGKLVTQSQFRKAAFKINEQQVTQYLNVEYDLAVAGSQMAGKWVDIEADAEIFPFVQFDVVLDTHTSEICLPLADVIVKVGDPFLDTYYPPNHFGCRTTVRKLTDGPATYDLPYPEIPKMFQVNLAKEGLVFPDNHAYFDGLPPEVADAAKELMPKPKKDG